MAAGQRHLPRRGSHSAFERPSLVLAEPLVRRLVLSFNALAELVVAVAIKIVVVQNGHGFAVLSAAGHNPPATAVTIACGVGGLLSAAVGAVGTCLTGPTNAIITSSGYRNRHYASALVTAMVAIVLDCFADIHAIYVLGSEGDDHHAGRTRNVACLAGRRYDRVQRTVRIWRNGELPRHGRRPATVRHWRRVLGLVSGAACSWLVERRDFRERSPRFIGAHWIDVSDQCRARRHTSQV